MSRVATEALANLSNASPNITALKKFNAFISSPDINVYLEAAAKHPDISKRLFAVKDNIATQHYPTTCASNILQDYQSPFEATAVTWLRNRDKLTRRILDKTTWIHKSTRKRREILGKTNMDEFGMGSHSTHSFFGPVIRSGLRRGPVFSAGGSSGGSAVVVATKQVQTALGTDTGGSVRLPAAYNGIVGFKPSYGLISRWGVVPYANSLDTVGILADNTGSLWPGLAGQRVFDDPRDPTSISTTTWDRMRERRKILAIESGRTPQQKNRTRHGRGYGSETESFHIRVNFGQLKIGIPLEYNIEELESEIKAEWQTALKLFQDQGCTLVPVSLPNTRHALSAYYVIAAAEAASNLSKYDGVRYGSRAASSDGAGGVLYSQTRGEGFGEEVKRRILLGSYSLSSKAIDNYFIKAQKVRRLVQRDFDRVFSIPNLLRPEEQFDLSDIDESVQLENKLGPTQVDFIVCPTAPTLPPKLEKLSKQSPVDSYMNDVFTVPSSLAGLPAVSLPFKLPNKPGSAGIQIIGQYSDDSRLLVIARAIELLQKSKKLRLEEERLEKQKAASAQQREKSTQRKKESRQQGEVHTTEENSLNGIPIRKVKPRLRVLLPNGKKILRPEKYYSDKGKARMSDGEQDQRPEDYYQYEEPKFNVAKFKTSKGDDPRRQPRTEKEISRSVADAFEDWESMVFGKR